MRHRAISGPRRKLLARTVELSIVSWRGKWLDYKSLKKLLNPLEERKQAAREPVTDAAALAALLGAWVGSVGGGRRQERHGIFARRFHALIP